MDHPMNQQLDSSLIPSSSDFDHAFPSRIHCTNCDTRFLPDDPTDPDDTLCPDCLVEMEEDNSNLSATS